MAKANPRHQAEEMRQMHSEIAAEKTTSWRELLQPGLRGALIGQLSLGEPAPPLGRSAQETVGTGD